MDPLLPIVPAQPSVAPATRIVPTDPDCRPGGGDLPSARRPRARRSRRPVGPPAGELADTFADGTDLPDDQDDGRPHVDVTV